MNTSGEVEVQLHVFLILALDGNEWLVSCPSQFTKREEILTPIRQEAG
jgi:hypothetical protein